MPIQDSLNEIFNLILGLFTVLGSIFQFGYWFGKRETSRRYEHKMEELEEELENARTKRRVDMENYVTGNDLDAVGTFYVGELNTSYERLVEVFGEPYKYEPIEKSDVEWIIKFDTGEIATIYNWKNGVNYLGEEGLPPEDIKDWNIGGYTKDVVQLVSDTVNGGIL